MTKILIAMDNGDTAATVAQTGLQLAQQLKASVAVISVVDTGFIMTDAGMSPKEMAGIIKREAIARQHRLFKQIFGRKKIQTFIEEGKAYKHILNNAQTWGADLIVLGTHGRTGVKHLLLGSVAEKVLRHSTIPLFIVPIK
jgi:nucleotide-binding universal stress UspA family protein